MWPYCFIAHVENSSERIGFITQDKTFLNIENLHGLLTYMLNIRTEESI